jgi:hypothetical protein
MLMYKKHVARKETVPNLANILLSDVLRARRAGFDSGIGIEKDQTRRRKRSEALDKRADIFLTEPVLEGICEHMNLSIVLPQLVYALELREVRPHGVWNRNGAIIR